MRFTVTDLELLDGSVGQLDVRVNIRHCLPNVGGRWAGKSVNGPAPCRPDRDCKNQSCQEFQCPSSYFRVCGREQRLCYDDAGGVQVKHPL